MLLKERLEKKEERSACRTNFKTFNNENMNCNYRNCLKELAIGINGNRRYCDDQCNYLERLEREKERSIIKKKAMCEINRVQALLRACHNKYGNSLIDINIVREQRMNWSIISETTLIEGFEYRTIGSFAYTVFEKSKIQIIKL